MRAISVSAGLALALSAAALVHAEPTWIGGKPTHYGSSPERSSDSEPAKESSRRRTAKPFKGGKECVQASDVRAESADTHDRLILHVGSGAMVSHLPAPCDGLLGVNNLAKLHLQAKNGKYCAGDNFAVGEGLAEAVGIGGDRDSTKCTLGPFEGVSEMSLSEEFRR
jgi:hypothetical protein